MDPAEAEARLQGFIARYADEIAARMRAARAILHARLPGAVELVYDNYNALALGYGSGERASQIICSLAAYPRWVSLFLARGVELDDPQALLKGQGARVRHIVLDTAERLEDPGVAALLDQAIAGSVPLASSQPVRTIIKSVSATQRPRRPG